MKKFILLLIIMFIATTGFAQDSNVPDMSADTTPGTDSLLYTVDDPGGTPADRKSTIGQILIDSNIPDDLTISSTTDINTTTGLIAAGSSTFNATMVLSAGSIIDSTGSISFGNESLVTTGNSSFGNVTSSGFIGDITGDLTGNADTVTTNANLTGDVTSVGNAATIADSVTVTGWVLGTSTATSLSSPTFTSSTGSISLSGSDMSTTGSGTFLGGLTGDLTGNADTVTTNANLTGEVTSVGNAATIADSVNVTGWVLGTSTASSLSSPIFTSSTGSITLSGADLSTTGSGTFLDGLTGDLTGNADTATNATNHIADNSQAHSDYLINNGNDTTSGILTASGGFISTIGTISFANVTVNFGDNPADNFVLTYDLANTRWVGEAAGAGSGDIEAVGDCTTGACFTGSSGTTLTSSSGSFSFGSDNIVTSGASTFGDVTMQSLTAADITTFGTGLSIIEQGIVINNGGGSTENDDFIVNTDLVAPAIEVDAGDDTIDITIPLTMDNTIYFDTLENSSIYYDVNDPQLWFVDDTTGAKSLAELASGSAEINNLETITTDIETTEIFVGNASNAGVYTALSQDVTMDNTGAVTIADSVTVTGWVLGTSTATSLSSPTFTSSTGSINLSGSDLATSGSGTFETALLVAGEKIKGNEQRCFTFPDQVASDDDVPITNMHPAFTMTKMSCRTTAGSTAQIRFKDADSNLLDLIVCAGARAEDLSLSNNTFTADESIYMDTEGVGGTVTWNNICYEQSID